MNLYIFFSCARVFLSEEQFFIRTLSIKKKKKKWNLGLIKKKRSRTMNKKEVTKINHNDILCIGIVVPVNGGGRSTTSLNQCHNCEGRKCDVKQY